MWVGAAGASFGDEVADRTSEEFLFQTHYDNSASFLLQQNVFV